MAMREECKHFQSRTYSSGEAARFCTLDLAPEAPWRCPENCQAYERRLADAGWAHGSLVEQPIEDEPDGVDGEAIGKLLDRAEDIVNAVTPEAIAEERRVLATEQGRSRRGRWPFRRRSD